jgi:hypothetical protein
MSRSVLWRDCESRRAQMIESWRQVFSPFLWKSSKFSCRERTVHCNTFVFVILDNWGRHPRQGISAFNKVSRSDTDENCPQVSSWAVEIQKQCLVGKEGMEKADCKYKAWCLWEHVRQSTLDTQKYFEKTDDRLSSPLWKGDMKSGCCSLGNLIVMSSWIS